MLTRRDFIKLTGASTIGWYVATQTGWVQWAVAQVPERDPRARVGLRA